MKSKIALVCILFSSLASAKEQTVFIEQMRGGLAYKSEFKLEPKAKLTEFNLDGFFEKWKCDAWGNEEENYALITCYSPSKAKIWKTQASVNCDSKDSFFIDAVTIKCKN